MIVSPGTMEDNPRKPDDVMVEDALIFVPVRWVMLLGVNGDTEVAVNLIAALLKLTVEDT